MPCFFCYSIFHPSHLCDVHVTNESRIKIAKSKYCCPDCLSDERKHNTGRILYKPKCANSKKCYECFSKDHFAFYCPQRFSGTKLFLPKIDKVLLPRFLGMFDALEQYSIGFLYPAAEKAIKFKQLKICLDTETTPEIFEDDEPSIVVALNEICLKENSKNDLKFFDAIKSKLLFNKAKKLYLWECQISANNLFLLLESSNIENLGLHSTKIVPAVQLSDILQKTPNLKNLDEFFSSLQIKSSWPDDLLQYTPNIKFVRLCIDNLDFEVKALKELLKPKNTKEQPLRMEIFFDSKDKIEGLLKRKFSGFARKYNKKMPFLQITVRGPRCELSVGKRTVFNFSYL